MFYPAHCKSKNTKLKMKYRRCLKEILKITFRNLVWLVFGNYPCTVCPCADAFWPALICPVRVISSPKCDFKSITWSLILRKVSKEIKKKSNVMNKVPLIQKFLFFKFLGLVENSFSKLVHRWSIWPRTYLL